MHSPSRCHRGSNLGEALAPHVDLGAMALGVPLDMFDNALEEAEIMVAPLVPATANIVNDGSLLIDEYLDEEEAPADPSAPP